MMKVTVHKVPMGAPYDVSAAARLMDKGEIDPGKIIAILGKTEGNGGINDFTRAYATESFQRLIADRTGRSMRQVARRVSIIWSGGTEGLMSPHATVFQREKMVGKPGKEKRLAVGVAFTRDILPEEIGRVAMVKEVAVGVRKAMEDAGILDPKDVHFVQIKSPVLTAARIADALRRGKTVSTDDTYKSMADSRAADALGIGIALGEIPEKKVTDAVISKDWSLYSEVASCSSGLEMLNCEIIVMGNSTESTSDFVIGHDVMKDALDADGVRRALRSVGIDPGSEKDPARVVNVFTKCDADISGFTRGRRHTMLDDSDIHHTRYIRCVVNAVVASVVGDPMVYVSAGSEHQGPVGGGVTAVIARV